LEEEIERMALPCSTAELAGAKGGRGTSRWRTCPGSMIRHLQIPQATRRAVIRHTAVP